MQVNKEWLVTWWRHREIHEIVLVRQPYPSNNQLSTPAGTQEYDRIYIFFPWGSKSHLSGSKHASTTTGVNRYDVNTYLTLTRRRLRLKFHKKRTEDKTATEEKEMSHCKMKNGWLMTHNQQARDRAPSGRAESGRKGKLKVVCNSFKSRKN